ncbi:hypothetical protein ACRRTK_002151 [Alexandromys fortis]
MPRTRQSSRQASTGRGSSRQGSSRQRSSRQGSARQGSSRQRSSRQGSARQGSARQGSTRQGSARQGSSRRGATRRRARARSARAGLTLSVSLVEHLLREAGHTSRLSETAPIFLTAILEFMVRRVLELAINEAQRRGAEMFITPELLDFTVYNNTPLSELFQFTTIPHVSLPEPGHRRRSSRRRQ